MKIATALLFIAATLAAEVELSGGFKYVYDSNIGQNISEEGGSYIVPSLGVKYDFKEIPLYISTDLIYDFHVSKRDYDDNSPFWEVALGSKFDRSIFRYSQKLFYELYLGDDLYTSEGDVKNWVPVFQTISMDNSFRWKIERNEIHLKTLFSYHGYGTEETTSEKVTFEKEGYYLQLAPKLKKSWSIKKKRAALKGIYGEFLYERSFLDLDVDSYNYWRVKLGADIKLFYPHLKLAVSFAEKHYLAGEENDQSAEIETVEKRYFAFSPKLVVPIISDLSCEIGGKFRIKESNDPEHNYHRNTFFAEMKWN